MCGISGAQGCDHAGCVAARISSNQIFRGKDSAGLAWPAEYDGKAEVRIFKRLGSPTSFLNDNRAKLDAMNVQSAIGHNRWPSHGDIRQQNAHPFKACDGSFALVHNGSASVPSGIWKFLRKRGHAIQGAPDPTDSEMFLHSIEELLKANGGDRMLALRAFNKIGHSFSILLLFADGEIWGTRDTWPAVIAQRNGQGTLIASVESAFGGIIPKDEKVKLIEPGPHSIYRIETSGTVTIWGDYSKEERAIQQATVQLGWYEWKPGDYEFGTLSSPLRARKGTRTTAVPDMELLQEATKLIPEEKFNLDSKKSRKRLRKLIKNNLWLQEQLDEELGLVEGESKGLFDKEELGE